MTVQASPQGTPLRDHERRTRRKKRRGQQAGHGGQSRHLYGDMGNGCARNARKEGLGQDVRKSHFRKASYDTLEEAREVARAWNERTAMRFTPLEAYRCRYRPHYHVGHMTERKARQRGLVPGARQ